MAMTNDQFRAWRRRKYRRQDQAAAALGVSVATISNFERGYRYDNGAPVTIDRRTELACAAIDAGIKGYTEPPSDEGD